MQTLSQSGCVAAAEVLADVELAKRNLDVAAALSQERTKIYERVVARAPDDIEATLDLAHANVERSIAEVYRGT
jgi:hypothetical protein